jgi:hypothetical protein
MNSPYLRKERSLTWRLLLIRGKRSNDVLLAFRARQITVPKKHPVPERSLAGEHHHAFAHKQVTPCLQMRQELLAFLHILRYSHP